jgi:hypothetical protein
MISRLLLLRGAVESAINTLPVQRRTSLIIDESEWKILDDLFAVLQPCALFTKVMQAANFMLSQVRLHRNKDRNKLLILD